MTTKEYLEQVTIGKLSELSGRILLKEYNPAWATRYEEERRKISQALGQDGVAIEHVGSTSVPGLCAKPILDILLLVKDASDEGSYVPALVEAGYTLRVREPDWFGHRMLKGTSPEVNLHVFSSGCAEAQRMLDFRDWLRTHEDDRNLYANTKRNLAQQTWRYVQDYADAKSDVVRAVFRHLSASYPIRPLTGQDIPEMQALFRATVLHVNVRDYTQEEVADWASCGDSMEHWQSLLDRYRFIATLDRQGGITGFTSMNAGGHLHSLFVHEDWQGKGIATRLLHEAERMAHAFGASRIHLEASITARPFFEKQGYRVVRKQQAKANRLYLTNYVMEKSI